MDSGPPDPDCSCRVCQRYSRAYIRHLFNVGEYLAGQLISYHNLHFYLRMVERARAAIVAQEFAAFYQKFKSDYQSNAYL
jgi:queuine tRNA-ribosyltransferase